MRRSELLPRLTVREEIIGCRPWTLCRLERSRYTGSAITASRELLTLTVSRSSIIYEYQLLKMFALSAQSQIYANEITHVKEAGINPNSIFTPDRAFQGTRETSERQKTKEQVMRRIDTPRRSTFCMRRDKCEWMGDGIW